MTRPPIALLTDFGLEDHYVGVVKAVLASHAPGCAFIDLSHQVPPQDIRAGAFLLLASVEYLPAGSVLLAVVDPGVGSERRALAVSAAGLFFVGPDNGLLSWALLRLARVGRCQVVERAGRLALGQGCAAVVLDRPEYWLPRVSATFHGRDLFAPVAARLASGTPLQRLGSPTDTLAALRWPAPRPGAERELVAEVVHVDRFGNLITSFEPASARVERVEVAGRAIFGLSPHFTTTAPLVALIGSSGLLEVAVPGGSAADALGVGVGAAVRVWTAPGERPGARVSSD